MSFKTRFQYRQSFSIVLSAWGFGLGGAEIVLHASWCSRLHVDPPETAKPTKHEHNKRRTHKNESKFYSMQMECRAVSLSTSQKL